MRLSLPEIFSASWSTPLQLLLSYLILVLCSMTMRVDAKVVMLGKESVGKTSLVERYVHHRFLVGPYQNTIGAAFVAKPIQVGDKVVTLGIWDTAGSERYEAMSRIYYRGARAAIVCYDLTDTGSFQRAKFWVKEVQNCEEHCKIYLCGTKVDLIESDRGLRQVDYHDVQDFADEIGAQHFETSSKTGNNVDELFQKVAEDFNSISFQFMTEETGIDLGQKKDSYFYSCCHN
ncbi:ras-related protein Rab-24 isoform X1 [Salmo salar]|uniref:Ras-related protein Rab-24 isoform X1 n=2 Tax=Salmo salar TaxID=8030 RepID=A0ABM3CSG9_SALSA|nr:ras-related protein Rab-24-like isoform X1 [Salmo salar]